MSSFSDQDFADAVRTARTEDLSDWTLFVEYKGNHVYRRTNPGNLSLYQYKCVGRLHCKAATLAAVYLDYNYRKVWDSYCMEFHPLIAGVYYYLVHYPYPMSNRDYVYEVDQRQLADGTIAMLARAYPSGASLVGEVAHTIRVTDYQQHMILKDLDDGSGCECFTFYSDDLKGSIPAFLVNWAASTAAPKFFDIMEDACLKYDEYLRSKAQQ